MVLLICDFLLSLKKDTFEIILRYITILIISIKFLANKLCIVFGCTGQDGSLACYSLLKKGYKVLGISRSFPPNYQYLKKLGIYRSFEIKQLADENELISCQKILETYKPDQIYNLAAQSSVGVSFQEPFSCIQSIYQLSLVILEAARNTKFDGNIFFAGSSEIFGNTQVAAGVNHTKKSLSPYAHAKEASMQLVCKYREIYALNCITGILFPHESILRAENFVFPKIIKGAVRCQKNKDYTLNLGNINLARDWGWAPDYVEAMQLMTSSKVNKDYVICTGKLTPLIEVINKTFKKLDMNWQDYVVINEKSKRSYDISQSFGDAKPLKNELGWENTKNIDDIIDLMISEHFE